MALSIHDKLLKAKNVVNTHEELKALAAFVLHGREEIITDAEFVQRTGLPFATAGTDGINTFYAEGFISKVSPKQLAFIVAHEAAHKALQHMHLYNDAVEKYGGRMVNTAQDFVINDMIILADEKHRKLEMPDGGLHDVKYRGWSTLQVIKDLVKNGQGKGGKGKGGNGAPLDAHVHSKGEPLTPEEQKSLETLLASAKLIGNMTGGVSRIFDEVDCKRDWTKEMEAWLMDALIYGGAEATWRTVDRRTMTHGYTLPGSASPTIGRVAVGIDTSGSIGQEELSVALGNIANILETVRPMAIDLFYWDTAVAKVESYEPAEYGAFRASTKPAGGGGTDGAALEYWYRQHPEHPRPDVVLQFTDGYVGQWGYGDFADRTLWVVSSNEVPPWGRLVQKV